ncbi:MAG: cobalt ECF transporter T component CbiQ [Armatimonadota bacterium]
MNTPIIPDWYIDSIETEPSRTEDNRKRKTGMYVRRALGSFSEALAYQLSGSASCGSWMSKIEPRAKIITILMVIVTATLVHGLLPLALILITGITLALSSGVKIKYFGRVWLGIPLFSLAIILPAVLNVITDGTPVITIWHIDPGMKLGPWTLPETLSVTAPGLIVALRFILRITACVTFASMLTATTEQSALINGLRRLGMPRVFGMVLAMMQRYLSVLLRSAEDIHLAKLSRTISGGTIRSEQRWVAAGMGSLFRRTYRLAEEIHEAMVSRGYDGDIQIRSSGKIYLPDKIWLASSAIFIMVIFILDRIS